MSVSSIRFVGHDASRTGAPASLLEFLRWLARTEPSVESRTLLLRGGPLLGEFAACSSTTVAGPAGRLAVRVADVLDGLGAPSVLAAATRWVAGAPRRRGGEVDVEVLNTLAALDGGAGRCARRVVVVHELDGVADRVLPAGARRDRAVAGVDHWLAAGPAVRSMLVERWGIDAARVTTVPEFVRPVEVPADRVEECRVRSGTTTGRALVVSCGEASARKGTDRFVDLVRCLGEGPDAPVGAWVGGTPTSVGWQELEFDRASAGLGDRLVTVTTTPDARGWIAAADVVVSTAREDPYPLVVLEAALAGRPVVAMDSGGVRSMLDGVGLGELVVDQGDVLGMARRVSELLGDPARRASIGHRLAESLGRSHLPDDVGPRWWSAIAPARGVG